MGSTASIISKVADIEPGIIDNINTKNQVSQKLKMPHPHTIAVISLFIVALTRLAPAQGCSVDGKAGDGTTRGNCPPSRLCEPNGNCKPMPIPGSYKAAPGQNCDATTIIKDYEVCQSTLRYLGYRNSAADINKSSRPAGCYYRASDGGGWFNKVVDPSMTNPNDFEDRGGICIQRYQEEPPTASCPVECSNCKEGATWDGGKSLSSSGRCEHYCSKWGFCGEGEKYQKDPSAVCYGCTND